LQADDAALGATHHGARHVEGRCRRRTAGDDECIWQRDPALEVVDFGLQAVGGFRHHHQEMLLQLVVLGRVRRQLGADGEELALYPQDDGVPAAVFDQCPRHTEGRDRFIDRAIGLGPRVGLRYPAAIKQAGLSPIPSLGDDALARDGRVLRRRRASRRP